jgi:hypothetical protein
MWFFINFASSFTQWLYEKFSCTWYVPFYHHAKFELQWKLIQDAIKKEISIWTAGDTSILATFLILIESFMNFCCNFNFTWLDIQIYFQWNFRCTFRVHFKANTVAPNEMVMPNTFSPNKTIPTWSTEFGKMYSCLRNYDLDFLSVWK